jgi:hypothetical protein
VISLTLPERFWATTCLAFTAAQQENTKRGDYIALVERISELPENGNLILDTHELARLLAACDATIHGLAAVPATMLTGINRLVTHLRTGADAHATGAAAGQTTDTGARSGP